MNIKKVIVTALTLIHTQAHTSPVQIIFQNSSQLKAMGSCSSQQNPTQLCTKSTIDKPLMKAHQKHHHILKKLHWPVEQAAMITQSVSVTKETAMTVMFMGARNGDIDSQSDFLATQLKTPEHSTPFTVPELKLSGQLFYTKNKASHYLLWQH